MNTSEEKSTIKKMEAFAKYIEENDPDVGFAYGAGEMVEFYKYLTGNLGADAGMHIEEFVKSNG